MKFEKLHKYIEFFKSVNILVAGKIIDTRYAREARELKKVLNSGELFIIQQAYETQAFKDILQLIIMKQAAREKKADFRDYPRHLEGLLKELCKENRKGV